MLARVERSASIVAQALAVIGLVLLVSFACGTLADGLLRRLVGRPIDLVRDVGGLVVAIAVACCFPLALVQRANITIKFISEFANRRAGRYLDSVAAVLACVILGFIARQFFIYAGQLAHTGDTTTMLSIKVAPFWFVVSIVLWIAAIIQVTVAASTIAGIRKPLV